MSNADILKTLTSFHKLFSDVKIVDNKELALLCDHMSYYLMEIISMHGLNRIKFNSIINVQPFNSLSSEWFYLWFCFCFLNLLLFKRNRFMITTFFL